MKKVTLWSSISAVVICSLIGLSLLGLGAYLLHKEMVYLQNAEQATAVVTDNKIYSYVGQDQQDYTYFCSVFQFQTKDGRSVSVEESGCANLDQPPDYKIGQKVDLYYDPQHPDNFQLPGFTEQYSAAVAATVAGAVIVLIGLVVFWVGMLARRRMVAPSGLETRAAAALSKTSDDPELAELAKLEREAEQNMKNQKSR